MLDQDRLAADVVNHHVVGGIGDHPQLVILDDRGRLQLPGQIFDEFLEYGRRHGMTSQLSSRIRVLPPTA